MLAPQIQTTLVDEKEIEQLALVKKQVVDT